MYDFSYFLQKPDTHDVMFKAADGSSAGFCKIVLLGLSEVWRTRDGECGQMLPTEGWQFVGHDQLDTTLPLSSFVVWPPHPPAALFSNARLRVILHCGPPLRL